MRHIKVIKTVLVFALCFGSFQFSWAQQDYKSVLKDSIAADGFLYHKITPNEDLRSLSDLYGVSRSQIKRLNPILRRNFESGLTIKLPANEQLVYLINQQNATKFKNRYVVQHQDTKFGISKQYGISIPELERLNPKIRLGLKEGDTLFVPKSVVQKLTEDNADFYIHLVVKGDTFYSLIRKYNTTKEELELLNPELNEGLKLGMYLRIPKVNTKGSPRSITVFPDSIQPNTALNVLILLPFKTDLDSVPFDNTTTISKLRNIVTEFYFGTEMALDSLSKQGVNIHAEVYDTKNNIDSLKTIFDTHDFSNVDVVVGPLFTKSVDFVSQNLRNPSAYILSPFSTTTKVNSDQGAKIVQATPIQKEFTDKTVNYITQHYTNEKLIVVTDTLSGSKARLNNVLQKLATNDSIKMDSIVILKPENGYIKKEVFLDHIDTITKGKNWVLNLTTDGILLSDAVNTLGVLPAESYDITMFTVSKGKLFDNFDNYYLERLHFFFPSDDYIDYNLEPINQFEKRYDDRYHNLPTEYSFKGFDLVYDALSRLARQKQFVDQNRFGVTRRLSYQFDFKDDITSHKIINKGVYLLHYDGLFVKLVE